MMMIMRSMIALLYCACCIKVGIGFVVVGVRQQHWGAVRQESLKTTVTHTYHRSVLLQRRVERRFYYSYHPPGDSYNDDGETRENAINKASEPHIQHRQQQHSSGEGTSSLLQLDVPLHIFDELFETQGRLEWLTTLDSIQLSDVEWIRGRTTSGISSTTMGDVLTISPSSFIQDRLENLQGLGSTKTNTSTSLQEEEQQQEQRTKAPFHSNSNLWARTKFAFEYRRCLLQAFSTFVSNPKESLADLLQAGQSNTHPLGFSVIAIPPHTRYQVQQVTPALAIQVPLVGRLYCRHHHQQRLPQFFQDTLSRQPHHCIGTPLGNFSNPPLAHELDIVAADILKRIEEELLMMEETTTNNYNYTSSSSSTPGTVLVHSVGSICSTYTLEEPCLLFVLSANFLPSALSMGHLLVDRD